ncbi:hypothetical protein CRM22_008264 [Opisthorchis felineus]|uniref:Ig-like domain-containing protein n=1 Tax=Opisthorchis felineus TaxID=147828 RepID=A0A4S2LCK9_OPIFE|nr:hypothetical protein CRM22_008264 [Opisthorchis felineus]TGZ60970.1 hypothetical protein CRM22_008264 [Opisthorchis felineus]
MHWELRMPLQTVICQTIIFLLALLRFTALSIDCPIQCNCVPNRMSCEVRGLKQLPEPYSSQLESLLVENQTFDSSHLGPSELSMYRTPEFGGHVRLKSLYIRSCNIRTIGRNAFESLGSRLELLDLTGNPLKHIADYAFTGLGQLTLILDKLDQPPAFDDHTFSGLVRMKSLIMRHSKLTTLPYQPLLQLTSDGKLGKLLLKGNQLRRLDSKYDRIFVRLQDFEINDNPWYCDCQLTWLIRRYRTMLQKRSSSYHSRQRRWDGQFSNNWELEDNQPKCADPASLAGRNFSDLITDMREVYIPPDSLYNAPKIFHCPPPQLESLDVLIDSLDGGENATASGSTRGKSTPSKPSVKLKCVVRGSRQMQVSWQYHPPGPFGPQPIGKDSNSVRSQNAMSNQYGLSSDELTRAESNIVVERIAESDAYSCLGYDVIGNVSTLVRIKWPLLPTSTIAAPVRVTSEPPVMNYTRDPAPSDWSKEILIPSDSVLHSPQYSLSQLMGAIIGTFLSTVLLFLGIHCALHWRANICEARKSRKSEVNVVGNASVSPAGTSSSNTSSSNTRLISSPKLNELSAMNMPFHLNPDAMLVTKNFLNAHLLQQAMNSAAHMDNSNLPVGIESASLPNSLQTQMHFQSTMTPGPNTIPVAYEPVAYSDMNNLTYDVPWMVNMNRTNPMHFPPSQNLRSEQQIPLLFNNQCTLSNHQQPLIDHNSGLPATLQIPPPPSIPQPSLPGTPSTATLNNDTMNRTPSSGTNLMILQAGYPNSNHTLLQNATLASTISSSQQQPTYSS